MKRALIPLPQGTKAHPQPLHPTAGWEGWRCSGIRLTLPLHKGLEEATQLLGGWGPLPSQQTPHSLQAFLFQILLLLLQLLPLILPGKGRDEAQGQASLPIKGGMSAFSQSRRKDRPLDILPGNWL